jgi:hypothetical protein
MVQKVSDEGTFSFAGNGVSGSASWKESFYEAWVRGDEFKPVPFQLPAPVSYQFVDHHLAGPGKPARALEGFAGEKFRLGPNNTLFLGGTEICSWQFTMTATFDMQNMFKAAWPFGLDNNVHFAGRGAHVWVVTLRFVQGSMIR